MLAFCSFPRTSPPSPLPPANVPITVLYESIDCAVSGLPDRLLSSYLGCLQMGSRVELRCLVFQRAPVYAGLAPTAILFHRGQPSGGLPEQREAPYKHNKRKPRLILRRLSFDHYFPTRNLWSAVEFWSVFRYHPCDGVPSAAGQTRAAFAHSLTFLAP
ncbi:hypothetical protein BDV12DRAFT_160734 [Aspergillus spectabilis]